MSYNDVFPVKMERSREQKEQNELRRVLSLKGIVSEKSIHNIWRILRKMQEELELPSLSPIRQHYYFYQKLEEIRKTLNLSFLDFSQLNQLYNEITALRELLGLPETTPIHKIITMIQKESLEKLASLDLSYNSLLLKILLLHSTENEQYPTDTLEQPTLKYDLDHVIFEILKAYGPLSRPELVHLTDVPRSTIYDSLQRLIAKGFAVQYSEKRSRTGRPITLFDALV
ncbi:MAG: helix-turn-helix domain-containing protein [Candidatus Hodarchaeales archaeon]|jgi:hypothetical protein